MRMRPASEVLGVCEGVQKAGGPEGHFEDTQESSTSVSPYRVIGPPAADWPWKSRGQELDLDCKWHEGQQGDAAGRQTKPAVVGSKAPTAAATSVKSYPSAASSTSRRLKDGPRRRPQEFDGTVSWEAYKTQFELLASARQWSRPEMAMQLRVKAKKGAVRKAYSSPSPPIGEFRGKCYSCGQQGHTKRYCPQGLSSGKAVNGRAGQYQYKPCCWNCGQGHKTAECALVSPRNSKEAGGNGKRLVEGVERQPESQRPQSA
ncbi:hypothetical protein O3P69_008434 [Scylla paramamosain]|uniref:CCHC-type domain-containing protein n=1 Tax=Scylla paramamosain TaxID=85552 RepID=A0AAW0SKE9_SCYPA